MIRRTETGSVTELRLDRPARHNALTPEALTALTEAVTAAESHVVYLHGAGDSFCAGADLDVVADLDREEAVQFARQGQRAARALASADAAVVAGIDGAARGGGVELALACDLRVATPSATFAETGVSLGLFGAWGGTHRVRDALSDADAFDLALTGRELDAESALRAGLVSRVVDDPRTVAERVGEHDPAAVGTLLKRLRDDSPVRERERREATAFGRLVAARDGTDDQDGGE